MEIYEMIELNDCPKCGGCGCLEEESNTYFINCMECGSHSVNVDFKTDDDRLSAAQRTARLWNSGKVISPEPGE